MLSSNMMAQQSFYIKFIIQLTFITNGLTLIDAPHRIATWFKRKLYEREHKHLLHVQPFRDDYQFDLAHNQSYCLVIFLNCLLFSSVVPIIPMFAALYFYIKYLADKYNLVFVYFKKYDSGGKVRHSVQQLLVFNLVFYLVVINSFFGLKFKYDCFEWLGPVIIFCWIGALCYAFRHHLAGGGGKTGFWQAQGLGEPEAESGSLLADIEEDKNESE